MVYVLEFKRTSDQRRDYREKGESRARVQHDVLIRSLEKVAGETESEGERWKVKLIVFVGGTVEEQVRDTRPPCPGLHMPSVCGVMIILLLFLQKQSLASAVYLFGFGTLLSGPGLKKTYAITLSP
jgi:hypothetical protein